MVPAVAVVAVDDGEADGESGLVVGAVEEDGATRLVVAVGLVSDVVG